MIKIQRALIAKLKADAEVSALIDGRIYPLYSIQGLTDGHLVYRQSGGTVQRHLAAAPKNRDVDIEIVAWSDRYELSHEIEQAVDTCLDRFTGAIEIESGESTETITIDRCLAQPASDVEREDGMYGVARTFSISYRV